MWTLLIIVAPKMADNQPSPSDWVIVGAFNQSCINFPFFSNLFNLVLSNIRNLSNNLKIKKLFEKMADNEITNVNWFIFLAFIVSWLSCYFDTCENIVNFLLGNPITITFFAFYTFYPKPFKFVSRFLYRQSVHQRTREELKAEPQTGIGNHTAEQYVSDRIKEG